MNYTLKMLLSLIENRYSSDSDFEKDFKLARSTVSAWRKGKLKSYEKRINEIAHFFDVPISYFYEQKKIPLPQLSDKDIEVQQIVERIMALPTESQSVIMAALEQFEKFQN